jgi:hypothetical protein
MQFTEHEIRPTGRGGPVAAGAIRIPQWKQSLLSRGALALAFRARNDQPRSNALRLLIEIGLKAKRI